MIILPDRNIARAKYLTPLHYREWRIAAPWEGRDVSNVLGIYFLVHAWRSNGELVWTGRFEDREDADEFMHAIFTAKIKQDRYLQRLSKPMPWSGFKESELDPAIFREPGIYYNLIALGAIGPSSGVWTAPGDCYGFRSRAGEFADVIGSGGAGAAFLSGYTASGGGGGGFARITAYGMNPGNQFSYGISGGGPGSHGNYNAQALGGTPGGATWFIGGGTLHANGGAGGGTGSTAPHTNYGGAGGAGTAGAWGKTGGRGGNAGGPGSVPSNTSGGGGASGPNGDGSQGGDVTAQYQHSGGGNANGNQIGGGGAGNDQHAANGNWYGPWGPGGGGGSYRILQAGRSQGGNGGHYGGGGGAAGGPAGSAAADLTSGAGGGGIFVYAYEPTATVVVTSISPNSGPTGGGQYVTIGGSGFVNISSANIGGAPITSMSVPHQGAVVGYTSAGGAGTYNVNVYGPYSTGVGGSLYTYVTPPSVSSCSPSSGPTGGGQYVIVNGSNLGGVSWVNFDGVGATSVSVIDANRVQCYTPAHAAGGSYVTLGNGYGSGGAWAFTFVTPPSVSSSAPSSGPTNASVLCVITGANMDGVSSVTFDGVASPGIAVVNSTTVHAWTPVPHAAGGSNVAVTNGYGTGSGWIFTYVTPPSLSAITSPVPPIGLIFGGTDLTLSGANLAGATDVKIGGVAATNVVVVNANTITCRTPAHADGLVSITATNAYGTATLANCFTYLLPASGFNMPMMGI